METTLPQLPTWEDITRVLPSITRYPCCTLLSTTSLSNNSLVSTTSASLQPTSTSRSFESAITEATHVLTPDVRSPQPRSFGPISCLGDILTSLFHMPAGSPDAVERSLIAFLVERAGLPSETAGGLFVTSSSMANLIGMMRARDIKLEVKERGRGVVYVSELTDHSVEKGSQVLGFEEKQPRMVETDEKFMLDVSVLRRMIEQDREKGLNPFLTVASAGNASAGSVDDLNGIADLSETESCWLHVDVGYGVSLILSKSHRHLPDGLGRVDSISINGQKLLFQTHDSGVLLVREKRHLLEGCTLDADYVRDAEHHDEAPLFWRSSVELARPVKAMKLCFPLRVLGPTAVGKRIEHRFVLAVRAEVEIRKLSSWEVLSPASMGIVIFRYEPPEVSCLGKLDSINIAISRQVSRKNSAAVLTTSRLRGKTALRMCSADPELKESVIVEVVKKLALAAGYHSGCRYARKT